MGASQIVQAVYDSYLEWRGEPDRSIVYEGGPSVDGAPERIEVFAWCAMDDADITTLATIGMSDVPLPGVEHRCELHFNVRKKCTDDELGQCSLFLANLAMYPFYNNTHFDWLHRIHSPGDIPLWRTATALVMHPRFVDDGFDSVETNEETVRIINCIPITESEAEIPSVDRMLDGFDGVDIFSPR